MRNAESKMRNARAEWCVECGLPENRNQPESTGINRNPPQSTGIHRNQPLNLRNQLPENRSQPESTTKPPKSTA